MTPFDPSQPDADRILFPEYLTWEDKSSQIAGHIVEWLTDPAKRTARVLICLYRGHLVALHGFIKKTRTTPESDLALARKRRRELER